MATFTFFHDFSEQIAKGVHNFSSHTFKVVLAAAANAPNAATHTVLADITQIANSGGYTGGAGGGYLLDGVTLSQTSNVSKVVITDEVITASGGSIGPFRYAIVYNDTATSPADALVGYLDYGSDITLADTESLTLDFNPSTGVLTVTV
jgi:tagatose-1,6-bisphosphate aldolase non-catalytic subunit AgaZ/GatZ